MPAWSSLPSLPLPPKHPTSFLLVLFLIMATPRQGSDSNGIYKLALESYHQSPPKRPRNHSLLWTALHAPVVSVGYRARTSRQVGFTPTRATTPSAFRTQESRTYARQLGDSKSPTQPKREGRTRERGQSLPLGLVDSS